MATPATLFPKGCMDIKFFKVFFPGRLMTVKTGGLFFCAPDRTKPAPPKEDTQRQNDRKKNEVFEDPTCNP